jgi:lipoyl(octanoyl) transferase
MIRTLGLVDFQPTYSAMQAYTGKRGLSANQDNHDQLWICEHYPVFTQGLSGKAEHVFNAGGIPIVKTDRGGQVTFHGPGQVVAYPLINLRRAGYFVKEFVYRMEEAVIKTLLHFGVTGHRVAGAPGIYVRLDDPHGHSLLPLRPSKLGSEPARKALGSDPNFEGLGKIAALGIKVSRHCTYHGLALNVSMDLEPFTRINPCGYPGLETVDLSTIGLNIAWDEASQVLSEKLLIYLTP